MSTPHILVIGASSIDIKGRSDESLQPQTSTSGDVRISIGGVARNVAENLARLDMEVILLSAVGNDTFGQDILDHTAKAGVDVSHVIRSDHSHSGAYLALLNDQGRLAYSIADMAIMDTVTPAIVTRCRSLVKTAGLVFLDGNVPPRTIASTIRIARSAGVPVAVDPTSVTLAARFTPHLADISLMTPNLNEAEVFCERALRGRRSAMFAARDLVGRGIGTAIITLGPEGLAYATAADSGWVPAIHRDIVDLTGAADALTAAVIFATLNDLPLDESIRLGVAAATLTYQSTDTVRTDLSLEQLYEQL